LQVPARIEKLIAEKQYYAAVQLHVQSMMMLERGLQTVGYQLNISLSYFQCVLYGGLLFCYMLYMCLFFGRSSFLYKENENLHVRGRIRTQYPESEEKSKKGQKAEVYNNFFASLCILEMYFPLKLP
jgi:hypothetical protein